MRLMHERFGVLRLRSGPKTAGTPLRMPPLSFSFGIPDPQASLFFKTILFRRKSIGTAALVCAILHTTILSGSLILSPPGS